MSDETKQAVEIALAVGIIAITVIATLVCGWS